MSLLVTTAKICKVIFRIICIIFIITVIYIYIQYRAMTLIPSFAFHLPNKYLVTEERRDCIHISKYGEELVGVTVLSANVVAYAVLNEYVFGLRIQPRGGEIEKRDGDNGQEGFFWINTKNNALKLGLKYKEMEKDIKEMTKCSTIPRISVLPGTEEYIIKNLKRFPGWDSGEDSPIADRPLNTGNGVDAS